jgi:hypothetical protein
MGGAAEDRIDYFERMLADNPTGLLVLANEYGKAGRFEDEAGALERVEVAAKSCQDLLGQEATARRVYVIWRPSNELFDDETA